MSSASLSKTKDPYLAVKFNTLNKKSSQLKEMQLVNSDILCDGCRLRIQEEINKVDSEVFKLLEENNGVIL